MTSKKQNALSIKVKVKILEAVDHGDKTKTEIAKEFGIPNSTLSTILKNRTRIKEAYEMCSFKPERKRLRLAKHENLDSALLLWFKQARAQNLPISGPLLGEKAELLAEKMGIEFKSNPGWIERFKARNGIVFKCVSGESKEVTSEMTSDWLSSTIPKLLKEFDARDIYNADEAGFFFRCLPEKTLAFKGEVCSGGKKSKERITVLVGCNADGSDKLPLFVIGKFLNPRCFKNVKTLPVEYTANKKAWMTGEIFTRWVLNLDARFSRESRKIALIIDNCPAHPAVPGLKSITLIFLPPNTTSVLQPCDQGIIKNLKYFYRKFLLRKFLASVELKEESKPVTILDSLHILQSAWRSVTSTTIKNCFQHSGFSLVTASGPEVCCPNEDELNSMFMRVSTALNLTPDITLEDYLNVDNDIIIAPMLTEHEIVEMIVPSTSVLKPEDSDDNEGEENEDAIPIPSSSEIRQSLRQLRGFVERQDDGNTMYQNLQELEHYIETNVISKTVQKKITDFFHL